MKDNKPQVIMKDGEYLMNAPAAVLMTADAMYSGEPEATRKGTFAMNYLIELAAKKGYKKKNEFFQSFGKANAEKRINMVSEICSFLEDSEIIEAINTLISSSGRAQ